MIYSTATPFAQLIDRLGGHATRERKLGIAYILAKRGPPPYDVATIAAVLAQFKPSGFAEADAAHLGAAIDSLATIDATTIAARFPSPVDFIIVTDIAIGAAEQRKTAPQTADTDDSQMIGVVCHLLTENARAVASGGKSAKSAINTIIVMLSARKKGDDATTPSDVAAMMCALIPGAVPTPAPEPSASASAMRSFCIGNTVVRVFQQAKQSDSLLSSAKELPPLQVGGGGVALVPCLDDPVFIADLEAQNREMHSYLRASLESGRPCFFLGCGPTDVATASFIAMAPSCTGYAISYKPNGVNTGAGMPLDEQHSHAGGKLLLAKCELGALGELASIVEIGADVTRRLQQNAYLLGLGLGSESSAAYLAAIADNAWKVASKPLGSKPLPPSANAQRAWKLAARINYSNPVSLFGGKLELPISAVVSNCALGAVDIVDIGIASVELGDVDLVAPSVDLVDLVDGANGLSAAVPVLAGARAKMEPEVFAAIQRNATRFALVQTVNGLLAWGEPVDAAAIEAALVATATASGGGGGVCLRIFGTASAPLLLPDGLLRAFIESAPEIHGVQTADQLFAAILVTMAARLCLVPIIAAEYGIEIHAADFVDEMPVPVMIESEVDGLNGLNGLPSVGRVGRVGLIGLRHSGELARL